MNAITQPITARWDVSREAGVDDFDTATSQWATRPDDERYTSLDAMQDMLDDRTRRTVQNKVALGDIRAVLHDGGLAFALGGDRVVTPTHHGFARLCQEAKGTPTEFIRSMGDDPELAVRVLQRGLRNAVAETPEKQLMTLETGDTLRAVTSTSFGRVWDGDAVRAIRGMIGDSNIWRVPTAFARPGFTERAPEVTKRSTTLYASDRDVFLFLVDETRPILGGYLPNGQPDYYSRGFIFRNAEVGGVCCSVMTFLYRWICENRSIREKKGMENLSLRHTKNAPALVLDQMLPALERFVNGQATGIADGFEMESERVLQAKFREMRSAKLKALGNDGGVSFLRNIGVRPELARDALGLVIDEEGHPAETVYDAYLGLTALGHRYKHQDQRLEVEVLATDLLDAVKVF